MNSKKLPTLLLGASLLAAGCATQEHIPYRGLEELAEKNEIVVQGTEELEKTKALFPNLERIKYVSDSATYGQKNISYWQTPQETIERGEGNCVDKAIYFSYLLDSVGINHQIVRGGYRNKNVQGNHMWVEAVLDGKEYLIDCSRNGTIYNKNALMNLENGPKYVYSNVDGERRISNHIEDYYNQTGKILDIRGFEAFGKALQLQTSEKF